MRENNERQNKTFVTTTPTNLYGAVLKYTEWIITIGVGRLLTIDKTISNRPNLLHVIKKEQKRYKKSTIILLFF